MGCCPSFSMGIGELSFESPPSLRVTWIIPDFFRLATDTDSLQSPDLSFADGRYCLRLYKIKSVLFPFAIGIELLNSVDAHPGRALLYEVELKSKTGEIDMHHRENNQRAFRLYRSDLESERDLYVPDGTLTLLCSLRLREQDSQESGGAQARVIPKCGMTSGDLSIQSFPLLCVSWRIPGFFQLSECTLESPEFLFFHRDYRLRLFPSGSHKKLVVTELLNSTDTVPGRHVSYEVGFKSTTGEEIDLGGYGTSTTRKFYILRSELHAMQPMCFPDGHLTVFCCMRSRVPNSGGSPKSVGAETPGSKAAVPHPRSVAVQTSIEEDVKEALPGTANLSSDLGQLLQKMPDSDACLVVSGREFHVHRNILRARSTVFDAMFGHETAERASGRVVIDDLDPDSFGDFLEYLYTGIVGAGLSDDNAFDLYKAADKYDVPALKVECVSYMCRSLSVDSFCDVLTVALRHGEEALLSQAVLFFKENMARIIVTVNWQQFVIDNGTIANELFIKAVVPRGPDHA